MRFYVDHDNGSQIRLWIAPDNPAETPRLIIEAGDAPPFEIEPNELRPDLREIGFHSSGLAGFVVTAQQLPEIEQISRLQLLDAETRIMVYARTIEGQHVPRKLFIWDSGYAPDPAPWRNLMARFALRYERFSGLALESSMAVLENQATRSVVVFGNANWLRVRGALDQAKFDLVFLMRDPLVDMARKLLAAQAHSLGEADASPYLAAASEALRRTDLEDDKMILRFFRTMDDELQRFFRSPVTRGLTSPPEASVRRQDVSVALRTLSGFDVVMTDRSISDYCQMLLVDPADFRIAPDSELARLAARLGRVAVVGDYLNEDLALYDAITEAANQARRQQEEGEAHHI